MYESVVAHQRFKPMGHRLRYRVYSLLIHLGELDRLTASIPVLSHNRFNLVSFHDADYGPRDGSDLRTWFLAEAKAGGVDLSNGRVELLAFPRILGYAFNPISVWFGYDRDDALRYVLYEVHNTFRQAHRYGALIPPRDLGERVPVHAFPKRFHVSPFMDRTGGYRMHLTPPGDRYGLTIEYLDDDGARLMTASQSGRRVPLTTATLLRQFFTKPLLTLKVIGGIHYEAIKLWFKGAKYRSVPDLAPDVTEQAVVVAEPASATR